MNRSLFIASLSLCAVAWACSSSDQQPATDEPAMDRGTTMPNANEGSNDGANGGDPQKADERSTQQAPADTVVDAALDDATSGSRDGGADKKDGDAPPRPDASSDASSAIACEPEPLPNDGTAQQITKSTCGTLTAGDLDKFFVQGRPDEPIRVVFSANGDALVTLKTNAGLNEAYFAKSFTTTVKPGDRKLFIDIGMAKGPVAYHLAWERQ